MRLVKYWHAGAEGEKQRVYEFGCGFGCEKGGRINSRLRWNFHNTINLGGWRHRQKLGWKVMADMDFLLLFFYPCTGAAMLTQFSVGWVVTRNVIGFPQRLNAHSPTADRLHQKRKLKQRRGKNVTALIWPLIIQFRWFLVAVEYWHIFESKQQI